MRHDAPTDTIHHAVFRRGDQLAVSAGSVTAAHIAPTRSHRRTRAAIVAAAPAAPRIGPHVSGFATITALPASLRPAELLARAVYESGWRPPLGEGPTRHELVARVDAELGDRSETVAAGR